MQERSATRRNFAKPDINMIVIQLKPCIIYNEMTMKLFHQLFRILRGMPNNAPINIMKYNEQKLFVDRYRKVFKVFNTCNCLSVYL